jgi:hypothetical protein
MRVAVPFIVVMIAVLAGCAESRVAGTLLYMTPYKYEEFDCTELRKRATAAASIVKQQEELMDRAGASVVGPAINAMVYGPDHSRAVWELRLYQDEIARKNCDAPSSLVE